MFHADDRRRHPRLDELFAAVEIGGADEVLILTVRNLSLVGALVSADGHDLGQLVIGRYYRVAVFDPEDELHHPVEVSARVVRKDGDALALTWDEEEALFQMQSFIERIQ